MSGTNQFQPFAIGSGANALTPSAYAALTTLISQGFQSGVASSSQVNTVLRQASFMASALGQVVANAGINANDDGNFANLVSALQTVLIQKTQVVGSSRNVNMTLTSASASATFLADEIVVESSLGGAAYQLASFSKVLNLSITGVGGMDAGTAPVSGFVAVYAIYNPTTNTTSVLGTNATSAIAPEIYAGSNMPSGYTASALISVWRTNASSQFVAGTQNDRQVSFPLTNIAFITSNSVSGSINASSVIPKNAKSVSGQLAMDTTGGYTFFGTTFGNGQAVLDWYGYAAQARTFFSDLAVITPQTFTYSVGNGSVAWNSGFWLYSYQF